MTRIAIGADHNGVALKARLMQWLGERGHAVEDLGTDSTEVVDYPVLCAAVGSRVTSGAADAGVMIGGSGQGEVIALNKLVGVRAGLAFSRYAVTISRGNNDANVLVLGANLSTDADAEELLELWLATPFKGGVHAERLAQISRLEAGR